VETRQAENAPRRKDPEMDLIRSKDCVGLEACDWPPQIAYGEWVK
jgi:hypothetical protein